mmetsp:Transcript_36248/g.86004  ORF Transcript_36248/g.86004 Transcript_36248/m.86004 type:complete len:412 (+) Transcript_36248:126-1361(+)
MLATKIRGTASWTQTSLTAVALLFLIDISGASGELNSQALIQRSWSRISRTEFSYSSETDFRTTGTSRKNLGLEGDKHEKKYTFLRFFRDCFKYLARLWVSSKSHDVIDIPFFDLPAIVSKQLVIKERNRLTKSQHASTLVEVSNGELLAAWFGGSWEKNPDVGIWTARFQGGEWSDAEQVILPTNATPTWNPVLLKVPATGEILLFYKVGHSPEEWKGRVVRSSDGGRTWSPPEELPKGIMGPAKNKPLVLADGTILSGSGDEATWEVHVETSRDNGQTWERGDPVPFEGAILQPSLFLGRDGRPRMICRSYGGRANKRYVDNNAVLSTADRSGARWSRGVRTNLPNPNAGLDAVRLADGRLLVAYNPNNDAAARGRASLGIAISRDDGLTWRLAGQLEQVDKAPRSGRR